MSNIQQIITFLKREYPLPELNPQWVTACAAALTEGGHPATIDSVHEQYLYSSLSLTTLPPAQPLVPSNSHNVTLFAKPTILQILSITEIASSAFQLQTVLEQRREVLSGQSRIRRMDDEEGEDELEEGKIPVYPRGMLKLELGCGDGHVVRAMEYKRLSGMMLGETALGAKLRIRNVRVLRGVLLLTPQNTEVLGGTVDELEADQPKHFVNGLLRRLGKPVPGEEHIPPPQAIAVPPPMRASRTRTPARAKPKPRSAPSQALQVIDDEAGPGPSRPKAASAKRKAATSPPIRQPASVGPGRSSHRPTRAARQEASQRVSALYDQYPPVDGDALGTKPTASVRGWSGITDEQDEEDGFDMDLDDSFLRQVDAATATALLAPSVGHHPPQHAAMHQDQYEVEDDEDNDYDLEIDDSFIRQIDEVEMRATTGNATGMQRSSGSRSRASASRSRNDGVDRIVVDSSEDEDSWKENRVPDIIEISD